MHLLTKEQLSRQCCICKVKSNSSQFELPGIRFDFLTNEPFICEKCIYNTLIMYYPAIRQEWKSNVIKYLKENE